jgi:serine/threonine-protein kinase Chk2
MGCLESRDHPIATPAAPQRQSALSEGYVVGDQFAEGNYSTVHHCEKNGASYACKVMDRNKLGPMARAGLDTEISVLKCLKHPNIIKLVHSEEIDQVAFLVMEMASGGELLDYLYGNSLNYLTEKESSCISFQLIAAVQHCHEKNVVHRDLSPSNILLVKTRSLAHIKIADFGFAKILPLGSFTSTILGNLTYLAPEIRERQKYNHAVDIWSLGIILHVLLFGYAPAFGDGVSRVS